MGSREADLHTYITLSIAISPIPWGPGAPFREPSVWNLEENPRHRYLNSSAISVIGNERVVKTFMLGVEEWAEWKLGKGLQQMSGTRQEHQRMKNLNAGVGSLVLAIQTMLQSCVCIPENRSPLLSYRGKSSCCIGFCSLHETLLVNFSSLGS